jgi:hypothetical protein
MQEIKNRNQRAKAKAVKKRKKEKLVLKEIGHTPALLYPSSSSNKKILEEYKRMRIRSWTVPPPPLPLLGIEFLNY